MKWEKAIVLWNYGIGREFGITLYYYIHVTFALQWDLAGLQAGRVGIC